MANKLPKSRSIPSSTPEEREAKRLHILEAAATEFAEFGFDATSIESIALRAEIGKGTIYNYTSSKGQLFSECLQLFCDELHQLLEESMSTSSGLPIPQRAILIGERLTDLAHRRYDFVTMYFRSVFGAKSSGRDLAVQSARDVIAGLAQLCVTGQDHGVIRNDAPADLIASLIFMNRLAYSRMLDDLELHTYSPTEHAAFLLDMHWRGIRADPDQPAP